MGKLYKPGNYHIGQLMVGNVTFSGVTAGIYLAGQLDNLDKRVARIGVVGNAFDNYLPEDIGMDYDKAACKAQTIGELIAEQGLIFVNGACHGIPNIAAQGSRAKNGVVTGFSPLEDETAHFRFYNWRKDEVPYALITYLGRQKNAEQGFLGDGRLGRLFVTRNVVNVFSSDAVVVIGGADGTNHEVATAVELGLPVMLLKGTGGVADKAKQYYESIRKPSNPSVFIEEESPDLLVERMLEELHKRGTKTRESRPGKDPLDTVVHKINKIKLQQQIGSLP